MCTEFCGEVLYCLSIHLFIMIINIFCDFLLTNLKTSVGAPIVKVEGVPDYLPPEKNLEINCSVQGFPVPSIVGEFRSCSNLSSCSSFEAINDTEVRELLLLFPFFVLLLSSYSIVHNFSQSLLLLLLLLLPSKLVKRCRLSWQTHVVT